MCYTVIEGCENMQVISFEKLYSTEFIISEPMAKPQHWAVRGNHYNAIGAPKISHTLLWFKNCSATIVDKYGKVLNVKQNQLAYMAKGLEYVVYFYDTDPGREDTMVIHFQMTDKEGNDIAPILEPIICIDQVDTAFALDMDMLADEFKKNTVCIPRVQAVIYNILASICKKQKRTTTKHKYACIRIGIELLEHNSNLSIAQIANKCGVSECYFRRLFQEYSGESPASFRQRHRIERAKQLLLSEENFTVSEIAQELGFSDVYHFSKTFKKCCGMPPTQFVRNITGG